MIADFLRIACVPRAGALYWAALWGEDAACEGGTAVGSLRGKTMWANVCWRKRCGAEAFGGARECEIRCQKGWCCMGYNCLWVALGGALGATLRYLNSCLFVFFTRKGVYGHLADFGQFTALLPTLTINVLSSFVLAFASVLFVAHGMGNSHAKLFLCVGLCGGFSTFSTFSYEALGLLQMGNSAGAVLYMLITCAGCFAGSAFGVMLARTLVP